MDGQPNSGVSSVFIKSINVYRWIFAIFGLTFPPPLSQRTLNPWIKRLILFVYLMYCAIMTAIVTYTLHIHNVLIQKMVTVYRLDGITKILSYVQNIVLVSVQIVMVVRTFWNYNNLREIVQMIAELEHDLTAQWQGCFRRSLLKWKLLGITGVSLVTLTVILIYLNYFLITDAMSVEMRTIILFLIAAMQIKCIEYGVYIQLIYEFIDCSVQTLVRLKADIEDFQMLQQRRSPWPLQQQLLRNQILLNRVLLLVSRVGQYFACPLCMIFFYNGEAILCTVNWAYVRYSYDMEDKYLVFRCLYILILLSNLFIVSCLTQRCIQKYQSIPALIHIINISSNDNGILMRQREYAMQIMHHKLIFTCNGYMDIDYKSYGKMLLVILSYVIILVQFKMEDAHKESMLTTQHILGRKE